MEVDRVVAETLLTWGITLLLGVGISVAMWAAYLFASRIKDERIRTMVFTFVEAAEQIYQGTGGATKFEWVYGELRRMFPRIDAGLLKAMIEQAVLSIRAYAEREAPPAPVQLQLVGFQPLPAEQDGKEEPESMQMQAGRHAFRVQT